MAAEKDLHEKELAELRTSGQVVVDMVDLVKDGAVASKTLVERLCEAPQKISSYLSEITKQYVEHVLGLFKSYWAKANLTPLGEGTAIMECSEERFVEYLKEVKPMAEKVVALLQKP